MSNFLERLKIESAELDEKLEKLTKFHKTKPFYALPLDDQNDLQEQLYCMSSYSTILRVRLAKAEGYFSGYKQEQDMPCTVGSRQVFIAPSGE